ncbi:hypothetical protein [Rhodococcoides corynebacterioides]|uniref:hypothetical protein n=1 Tax=Rhodococcoides corynebacterioides TaxID=53972 RepID=UPI001C9A2E35|nr:hypothetical protein [Rhodococcus corynebacterioides]MBY6362488.1 hypothetical protein [Rhodococcus corynebacterioides]
MIQLANEHIEVGLEPEYGAQILSITAAGSTANALAHYDWRSPTRARDGHRYGTSGTDWLSDYRGGWQELFPNSGAESTSHGITTPFHGEASVSRWDVVEQTATSCRLRVGARTPLTLTRTMRLDATSPCLFLEEAVVNDGTEPADFVWGHHPVVPTFDGSRIDLPTCTVDVEPANTGGLDGRGGAWPLLPGAGGTTVDLSVVDAEPRHRLTYQHSLSEGWVAYRPPASADTPGIALAWDLETWPALWLWTLTRSGEFPWFGRASMMGVEPNRAWPFDGLDGARARGQHLRLEPGAVHTSWLTLRLLTDQLDVPVSSVERDGTLTRARADASPGT